MRQISKSSTLITRCSWKRSLKSSMEIRTKLARHNRVYVLETCYKLEKKIIEHRAKKSNAHNSL